MSKKETQNTEEKPEKIVTKYDLKVQRRKEEKEKAERSRRRDSIIGIALVVVIACIVASFPIRNYLSVYGTYIRVNGEKVTRVEFDYNYNVAYNSYISQNAYLLYMMGIDPNSDLTNQMYSDTMTWGDFFQEMAVESIARNRALISQAKAENFSYDVSGDYEKYETALEEAASEAGRNRKTYLTELYGPYATSSRIKPVMEDSLYASAYYDELAERNTPSQEEIQAHYDDNKDDYDSVDYYVMTINAELPTEPTELADPVEETEGEGTEEGTDDGSGEAAYEPSEAEIEAAMKEAKKEADRAEKTLRTDGELRENMTKSSVTSILQDWLFDAERKSGDVTTIEDTSNNRYYVVGFEDRYLDETLSVDLHMIMTDQGNGQDILDEWAGGAATEESFAEICDKYNDPSVVDSEGGLVEAATASGMPSEVSEWTHDSARKAGDTTVISSEGSEYAYVLYYVGTNEAEWSLNIKQTLLNQTMMDYMDQLTEDVQVDDPKGYLRYLSIRAAEEAAASEAAQSEEEAGSGSAEDGAGEDSTGSTEDGSGEDSTGSAAEGGSAESVEESSEESSTAE